MVLHKFHTSILALGLAALLSSCSVTPRSILDRTRTKHKLPAMAALVIKNGAIVLNEAVGTTRIGGSVRADSTSKWHLGSCTKAITSVIIATVVDEGKLSWDTRVIDVFPEWKDSILPEYHDVTVKMLLSHQGGLQHSISSKTNLLQLRQLKGSLVERRLKYVFEILQDTPITQPGGYSYSNAGFALAAAMAERVTKKSYEDLAFGRLFRPLGLTSVGFGPQNYLGGESQPMPHSFTNERFIPIDSGTFADNPDVMNPAGRLHMTLADWSKFALFEMGKFDSLGILKRETLRLLQRPHAKERTYSWGWEFATRDWAADYILVHGGSNTMNYAVIWVAPSTDFAIIIVTNAGTSPAPIMDIYKVLLPMYMKGAKMQVR